MLYFDRTEVSEGIDLNKTSASKEFIISHYWYFFIGKFQPAVCNGCHNVLMMPMNLNNITILIIHGVNYLCIISGITEIEFVNLLKNADLTEKLLMFIKHNFSSL